MTEGLKQQAARRRLILLNPNTNAGTTTAMVEIARAAAPGLEIIGVTAPFGAQLISTPAELETAAHAVEAACGRLADYAADGVIIAAFGDPGLKTARQRLAIPVIGLAQAAMLAAAEIGRFSVVTTTPALAEVISKLAMRYGCGGALASVRLTNGDPETLMGNPAQLVAALEQACWSATRAHRIAAIVIGGGPLGKAAQQLAFRLPVPIIEPVAAAVAHLLTAQKA